MAANKYIILKQDQLYPEGPGHMYNLYAHDSSIKELPYNLIDSCVTPELIAESFLEIAAGDLGGLSLTKPDNFMEYYVDFCRNNTNLIEYVSLSPNERRRFITETIKILKRK